MTVASAQTLRRVRPLFPFHERTVVEGMTYGLGPASYDVRIDQDVLLDRGVFRLASTVERFSMPTNLIGVVHDKSSWVRCGLTVQNTVIDPGWRGFLTLELVSHWVAINLKRGMPIAQIVFHFLDEPTETPYVGKYQDQAPGPQGAKFA